MEARSCEYRAGVLNQTSTAARNERKARPAPIKFLFADLIYLGTRISLVRKEFEGKITFV